MDNTGRLLQGPAPTARRILFGAKADASIDAQLKFMTEVDTAHLIMLAECGLIESRSAGGIIELEPTSVSGTVRKPNSLLVHNRKSDATRLKVTPKIAAPDKRRRTKSLEATASML